MKGYGRRSIRIKFFGLNLTNAVRFEENERETGKSCEIKRKPEETGGNL
jgi:hypothetical protein